MITKEIFDSWPTRTKKSYIERFKKDIEYPVLYDVYLVLPKANGDMHRQLMKRGFFDYDENIFRIPRMIWEDIIQNYPLDKEVIEMTGYILT